MVRNVIAHLLDLGRRRDSRDELLEVTFERSHILNVEEDEVLRAFRDTESIKGD